MGMKEFRNKYEKYIRVISREYQVDMGVACDILIANIRNRKRMDISALVRYRFSGDDEIELEEIEKDIKEMEEEAGRKRKERGFDAK